ncbi:MAG: twin-arginine translocation signal domain-containing protein, partial [Actinomadura rubrobrunea]|nr:twin-arginine translocation signal domain-containing protein [Actinomadura rubrobrunea]
MERRAFLKATGLTGLAAAAGCSRESPPVSAGAPSSRGASPA